MTHVLFTLGYQLRDIDAFIRILRDARIDALIDVRETAWSHKVGFSKASLEKRMVKNGIAYVHAPFAGNPKAFRDEAADHAECLSLYRRYIRQRPEILAQLSDLLDIVFEHGGRACFMCYERHPVDCHRSILLDEWSDATGVDIAVTDLSPDGAPRFLKHPTPTQIALYP